MFSETLILGKSETWQIHDKNQIYDRCNVVVKGFIRLIVFIYYVINGLFSSTHYSYIELEGGIIPFQSRIEAIQRKFEIGCFCSNNNHVSHLQLKTFNSRHQQKHGLETSTNIIRYFHVISTSPSQHNAIYKKKNLNFFSFKIILIHCLKENLRRSCQKHRLNNIRLKT